jgi:LysM repeat protein
MARRSPARYLAPLALVATVVALFVIVSPSSDDEPETSPNRTSESSQPNGESGDGQGEDGGDGERKGPRRYTVRPGDTPSAIAERTGVPLETILELNPDLDPQTLSPGQRLKLRESGQ